MFLRCCFLGVLAVTFCLCAGRAVAGSVSHHTFASETLDRPYAYNEAADTASN